MTGPGDLGNLLKQAQKMQREMDLARQEIAAMTVEGSAGGGAARVEVDGDGIVKAVHLSKEAQGGSQPRSTPFSYSGLVRGKGTIVQIRGRVRSYVSPF